MVDSDELKQQAADKALEILKSKLDEGSIIGVGTGTTVECFIKNIGEIADLLDGAVSSSDATTEALKKANIPVVDLNTVSSLAYYVDGCDEINPFKQMIKGAGGALTREKIIAATSRQFICIADERKVVNVLGKSPLPIEVIPMARSYVARKIVALGGSPALRKDYLTDNGNPILDVHGLTIAKPRELEDALNQIEGVVASGLFANRGADTLIIASQAGITVDE